ncbi:antitoxin, partial [Candidatus Micrarchaeota archaeon CG08_land_8_20_14_0_20_49_17]
MKTITLSEDVYDKLAELKHEMSTRSFSELLRKILSKDRVEWVYRYAGK